MPKSSRIFFLSLLIFIAHVATAFGNTEPLSYHATQGSLFYITCESVGLPDGFKAKPDVFLTRNDSLVGGNPIEVLADPTYFEENSVNSIACQVKTPLASAHRGRTGSTGRRSHSGYGAIHGGRTGD